MTEQDVRGKNSTVSHRIDFGEYGFLKFQQDPRSEGINGLLLDDVLERLIEYVQGLNSVIPSRETALTVTHLETALLWQKRRYELRWRRGVADSFKA